MGSNDADQDGLPDASDACPAVSYAPGFDWSDCPPLDQNPGNNIHPECKARERIVQLLGLHNHVAFAVVKNGEVHFADAFKYLGAGQTGHDPDGIHRLYRTGSTSKPVCAVAAKILEEDGELSLDDFVSDDDGTQVLMDGEVALRGLLSHRGAFSLDNGALHLFCYPGNLAAFWAEPDDLVSPHYDSATWGNLGGGYNYSAFNYALAGAYLTHRAGESFEQIVQTRVFDPSGMCTATVDGLRAAASPIGGDVTGVGTGGSAVVGPYINLVSPTDTLCDDNYYSSEALPGDPYTFLPYRLDEASADVRDPAGGVIASVVDMAHFARTLLAGYHGAGTVISHEGVTDLWEATTDLEGHSHSVYHPYYGIGFFTDNVRGDPITQVGHGGSRAGYSSAFVLRPEANLAISILVDANASTVAMSDLAKIILDDFEHHCPADLDGDQVVDVADFLVLLGAWGADGPGAWIAPPFDVIDVADFLGLLATWGTCP
jgi:CubicO group peptidase (beta-lactamase class C family)